MTSYITRQGDILDAVALDQMGSVDHVAALLNENPGLSSQPDVLDAGIEISIPVLALAKTRTRVTLWGTS